MPQFINYYLILESIMKYIINHIFIVLIIMVLTWIDLIIMIYRKNYSYTEIPCKKKKMSTFWFPTIKNKNIQKWTYHPRYYKYSFKCHTY